MNIRAVLWDFGGVFTTSPFDAFNRFEIARGLPPDFIRSVNTRNPLTNAWARFESSQSTVAEFDREFAAESKALGHEIAGRELLPLLAGTVRPRMIEVLKRCKARYRCACITNNARAGEGPTMATSRERAEEVFAVMALFDFVIESSKLGIRKPDPRIYEIACERLEIPPADVVFLDDLGINLKPARAMGMTTIKVVSEDQAIAELGDVLGMSF